MSQKQNQKKPKVLVVEDEEDWQRQITSILHHHCPCDVVLLDDYGKADQFVTAQDLSGFDAAVIDVRLRKQVYDQGGLTILDLLKQRRREIPVLILTAYSYDYPGLTGVTQRYPRVLTYDKEVFKNHPAKILEILLADLPPEIGTTVSRVGPEHAPRDILSASNSGSQSPWREVLTGSLVVSFVLGAVVLFFYISNRFPEHALKLNVIFGLVVIALFSVFIRIFKPDIVSQALRFYKDLTSSSKRDRASSQNQKKDDDD